MEGSIDSIKRHGHQIACYRRKYRKQKRQICTLRDLSFYVQTIYIFWQNCLKILITLVTGSVIILSLWYSRYNCLFVSISGNSNFNIFPCATESLTARLLMNATPIPCSTPLFTISLVSACNATFKGLVSRFSARSILSEASLVPLPD